MEQDGIHNLDRMSHIKRLGDDMQKLDVPMSETQRLLYIEAIFVEANHVKAIEAWEANPMKQPEYWELGTRMLSRHGLLDRAMACAETFFERANDPNSFRLLLPLIAAALRTGDEFCLQRAWALYIRLRFNLGDEITMEDYDAVIVMFMEANKAEQALAVFKDMMLTGIARSAYRTSIARYMEKVGRHAILSSVKINAQELDWQNFQIVDKFPSHLNNHMFFGSWIKKLIGDGELDYAEKVYHLMQEHKIRPSSISINGLIGAWFRKGNETSRTKAETLAWRMIKERIDVVAQRRAKYDPKKIKSPIRLIMTDEKPDFIPVTWVPYATIETFTILLRQYRRQQKHELIPGLFDALREARIKPDIGFMNQLLVTENKAQMPMWAWDTYCSLTDETKPKGAIVQPNYKTYQILWELLAKVSDPITGSKGQRLHFKFASPRVLFADMMKHMQLHKDPLPNELYQTIILCFCLEKDQVGTAVALRALQHYFHKFPSENTARAIILQLARTGLVNEHGRASRRLASDSRSTKERVHHVTQLLQYHKDQRVEALKQQGIIFDELEGNAKLEQTLVVLSSLLRFGYQHKPVDGKDLPHVRYSSYTAARQMGVPESVLWEDIWHDKVI